MTHVHAHRIEWFGSLRAIDQEPLESRNKMNNELLTKSFRFANVGRPDESITKDLSDEKEKKEALERYMADRKAAQKKK
jgi:hypothetical protein